uniref:exodeoxyribonuclease V subunit beta n=1 Tax=Thaumasiovibrio occultus TaxID=1891184 RepID=UPI000B352978|nr:exodeoxyribonuclease V subunit beta [Thaumasiovibrio occultus]
MTTSPTRLDPLTLPLTGRRLIEASAGTGKTYTIAGLYLRLLLGHGSEGEKHPALSVDQILVVTFTEAATAELRDRIRRRIHQARIAFTLGQADDDLLQALLAAIDDHTLAAQRLLEAERQMDEAAIYTIHGFCQRMLSQNAFESGVLFDSEFITDETRLRFQAVADYWRRRFYPLESHIAAMVRTLWGSPHDLLKDINKLLSGPLAQLNADAAPADLTALIETYFAQIDALKAQWLAVSGDMVALINASGVNKRSYTKASLPKAVDEMTAWASQKTTSFALPKAINKFSQRELVEKTTKDEPPYHAVFDAIDALLDAPPSLREPLLVDAVIHCRQGLAELKAQQGWLSFDDLLSQLSFALESEQGELLASRIRELYPVAMIDEFQDTDPLQYHIFSSVYPLSADSEIEVEAAAAQPTGLLMIGDPKQAIYAFRGADIFTYIQARRQVSAHYTLDTNWRSSADMVDASNAVFARAAKPFIYDQDIPFLAVNPNPHAAEKGWWLDGQRQPAMTVWQMSAEETHTDKGVTAQPIATGVYRKTMATAAANEIASLLSKAQEGRVVLGKADKSAALTPGNIAVLVRTGFEAQLVKQALAERGVDSVYLSNRERVLDQSVAQDLARILAAVLDPENETLLRAALASPLMDVAISELDRLNFDEVLWEQCVGEFRDYSRLWHQRGIAPMLRQLLFRRRISERLLTQAGGERTLTDVLHIAELLQSQRQLLDSEPALLRWLEAQLVESDGQNEAAQLRLESERNLVQIVTIHKSKGLEYDLVFLPFVCDYRNAEIAQFHDEQTGALSIDLYARQDNKDRAEQERLAEDLRLLYVALTRAVYGCYLGTAPIANGKARKEPTGLHYTAIGWLWQGSTPQTCADWQQAVSRFTQSVAGATVAQLPDEARYVPVDGSDKSQLSAAVLSRHIDTHWWVTSYSGLVRQASHSHAMLELPGFDKELAQEQDSALGESEVLTIADFPKGAVAGTFLHTLFEETEFTQDVYSEATAELITQLLEKHGYEPHWQPILQQMMSQVLACPLDGDALRLNQISAQDRLVELEFMFPVHRLAPTDLNQLLASYGMRADPPLQFDDVSGMLKGFIDLVFSYNGQFYVLDWKSNWLGEKATDYTPEAVTHAMRDHRYDLQYLLYTLALHRYLKSRIADYNYEQHIGGVYYLFLRGVTANDTTGIFHARPPEALILALDALMEGQ